MRTFWLETIAKFIVDAGVSALVVRQEIVERYIEMGDVVSVHENDVLGQNKLRSA